MFHILSIILAISLTVLVLGTGMNWINTSFGVRKEATILAQAGFDALSAAITAYRMANGSAPAATSSGAWPAALVPAYVQSPRVPEGMAWSYGQTGGRLWFCLSSGSVSEAQWDGLKKVVDVRPEGTTGLVSTESAGSARTCGTYDGSEPENDDKPAAFPASAYLTFEIFR